MNEAIIFRSILEIVGKPKEHIEQTMDMYIDKIKKDRNLKIISIDKPEAESHEKDLFSVIAELEIKAKTAGDLMLFCYEYMPGSVEILEPGELIYKAHEFTGFINDIQSKLHKVDMLVKNLSAENQVITKNGTQLMKNIVLISLESGPRSLTEISKMCGMPEEHINKFVKIHIKENRIKEIDGKYALNKKES
jgi:hypothetical protein